MCSIQKSNKTHTHLFRERTHFDTLGHICRCNISYIHSRYRSTQRQRMPRHHRRLKTSSPRRCWGILERCNASGHILSNHSDEVGAVDLPDLGMDIFDHSVNQSATHIDGCAWTLLDRLVEASSAGPTLGPNMMAVNAAAVRNAVEGLRPAAINNVLHRSRGPTSDAVTRRLVADEVLAVIELLIEESYANQLVGEVGEFLR